MATFDLSSIVEQRKKKEFPPIVSVCTADTHYLTEHPELLQGKHLSVGDINNLPTDHEKYSDDEANEYKYFSCISDIFPDATPFSYNGEIVGDQVVFNISGLHCVSQYTEMSKLNSQLQSIKTLLNLMNLKGHIHTSSFRVKKGKNWVMEYRFVFTSTPLSHSEVFGYGSKGKNEQDGGQDAGQDVEGGEGGGQDANPIPL